MLRTAITAWLPIGALASAVVWTVAGGLPDHVAPLPGLPAVRASPAAACPEPEPAHAPVLAVVRGISEAVEVPPPSGITTFQLPRRGLDAELPIVDALAVRTRCDRHGCVDGLVDRTKTLIAPKRYEVFDSEAFVLERVVHVADVTADKLSVYVATSEYSGGAHANNDLECRTYRRKTGERLRLRDVMPARSAALVLAKVRALFEPERAIEGVGATLPAIRASAREVSDRNLRVEHGAGRDHVVLCVSSDDGKVLEVHVDALPVDFLLR